MLFNSLQFGVFFITVYILYLVLNHKWQNRMLLVASYIFYGFWDVRFLSLIFISTVLDYVCGLKIYESEDIRRKKLFLFLSICGNLLILGFFKYFNFFASNLQILLGNFGFSIQPRFLSIILPVGISFYTLQTMSYAIDIYRGKMRPTRKFFDFALFVAFFPQLVAGPIERARHLLPQMLSPRKVDLDKFYKGCYLIFWGLFQKVFVADNLALIVDPVFAAGPPYSGVKIILASYAFAFQIFCDFAGYSNIARGLGKCMGFDIMINFNIPYFATNPREFWQRWHISLSSWLRDYLYIPLGGNRNGRLNTYRNIAITMFLGGLWHGAKWTFIAWGMYQAMLLIVYRLFQPLLTKIPTPKNIIIARIWFIARVLFFFQLMSLGWLIFRAESIRQAFAILQSLVFSFSAIDFAGLQPDFYKLAFYSILLLIVQYFQFRKNDLLVVLKWPALIRTFLYVIIFYSIVIFGVNNAQYFFYFQF